MTIHGTCKKTIPNGNTGGHCGACHESFIGNRSFEAHRVGQFPDGRHCEIQPYDTRRTETGNIAYGHWQDDRGFWRHGKQLTDAEKAEVLAQRLAGVR